MSEQFPTGEAALHAKLVLALDDEHREIYGDQEDAFVGALRELATRFIPPQPDLEVLYPGSAAHAGVARVFGKEHVTHVDPDATSMALMGGQGYRVIASTLEEYQPAKKADLLISYNAGTISPEELDRLLKPGGTIIANNWHGSAAQLANNSRLELLGAILPDYRTGDLADKLLAKDGAGTEPIAVTREGKLLRGEAALETGMATEQPKNPDGLFVFRQVIPALDNH